MRGSSGWRGASGRPRRPTTASTSVISEITPSTMNTPRQWMKSATMPDAADPSRLPVMVPASSRPIATWRCASGTRSDSSAMPSGNRPPQPAPAITSKNEQLLERGRHGAEERRDRQHDQAADHHALLADGIRDRSQHRQHHAVGDERRRQHGRGRRRQPEIVGDLRNHRVDRPHRKRGRKRHERDDREGAVHCAVLDTAMRPAASPIGAIRLSDDRVRQEA